MGKKRKYTDEIYNRLCNQIEQINSENKNSVTDFLGDAILNVGKWVGLLQVNDSLKKVEKYHKRVLDMNNTTKGQLKKIFEKVEAVDNSSSKDIDTLNSRMEIYINKIKKLHSMITPTGEIESAQYIKKQCQVYNSQLKVADQNIRTTYTAKVQDSIKNEAIEGGKGIVKSVLKVGIDIFSMPAKWIKAYYTGGMSGLAKEWGSDTWGLINDVFATAGSLTGLAGLGVAEIIYAITKNPAVLHKGYEDVKDMTGGDGLYDVLNSYEKINGEDKFTSSMKKATLFMDRADTTVSLVSDAKDFLKNPMSTIIPQNPMKHSIFHKADMTAEAQQQYKHIQNLYNKFEKEKNIATTVGKIYSYAENIYEMGTSRGVAKELFNNSKLAKDLSKILNFKETYRIQ